MQRKFKRAIPHVMLVVLYLRSLRKDMQYALHCISMCAGHEDRGCYDELYDDASSNYWNMKQCIKNGTVSQNEDFKYFKKYRI